MDAARKEEETKEQSQEIKKTNYRATGKILMGKRGQGRKNCREK
jgi:hypothetical protein